MSAVNASLPQSNEPYPEPRSSEPSMEDILASIRRIIADDQSRNAASMSATFRRQTAPVAPPEPAVEATPPADEPVADATTESVEPTEFEPIDEPVALAADLYAQPHLNAPPVSEAAAEPQETSVVDAIADTAAASILRPPVTAPSETSATPAETPAPAPLETAPKEPDRVPSPVATPAALVAAARASAKPKDRPAEPLLSPSTDASVGSSLQALATSVFLQNTDAVQQMTRDLLRPMLKTWLDDHLPAIVERLVRNEIERVARGGKV
jgi:hypothetical protein